MAESSVGTISLDLVIQNNIAEQIEKIRSDVSRPARQIGENIETSVEAPMKKTAENVQKTLGSAFEETAKTAQKTTEKITESLDNGFNEAFARMVEREKKQQAEIQKFHDTKPRTVNLGNAIKYDTKAIEKEIGEYGSKIDGQFQKIFDRTKGFKIPTTPVERLEAELENTRTKSDLLKAEWEQLANSEPSEKATAKMLSLQQQIIATDKATERLESDLQKTAGSETLSTVDAQFQRIFDRLKNFEVPTTPVECLKTELENIRTKIALLQRQWQELSTSEPSDRVAAQMLRIQQQIISAQTASERLRNQLSELNQTDVSHLKQEWNELVSLITAPLKGVINTVLAPVQAIASGIQRIGKACHSAYENLKYYLENPLYAVRDAGKLAFSAIEKVGSKAFGVLKSVGGRALDSLKSRFRFLNKSAMSLSSPIKKLGRTLKNTFRRVFVMATLYAAVKSIKKSFSEILKSNEELSKSLNNVKANLSIAFTPVIQAIIPALNTMMSGLAKTTRYVAGFTAGLFGMTYKQAAEATQKLKNTGKTATDTAKKVNMSLAGIDEMNILSDNSDESGNDEENSGIDYSNLDMSEPELPDWAERLKNAIKSGDWYSVGEVLAERINAVFEGIDWENTEKKVTAKINKICDLINGFVDNINFDYLGNALAGGLNTISSAVNTFSDNIHWETIGSGLANGLNQAISKIKWKQLGKSISSNIRILTDLLYGFVTEFNWAELGNGIGEAVNGWFDGIDFGKLATMISEGIKGIFSTVTATLQTVDFSSMGNKLAESVNNIDVVGILKEFTTSVNELITGLLDFLISFVKEMDWLSLGEQIFDSIAVMIENIDWKGLIERVAELLGGAVGGAAALIGGILMKAWNTLKEAWDSVKEYFHEKIEECGGNVIKGVFKGIVDAFKNVGNWIKEHIFKPFINGFKKAFGIHSPSKKMAEMGGYIIDGLFNAISEGITKIREIFEKMLKIVKAVFSNVGEWFKDKFSSAWDGIKYVWNNVNDYFLNIWNGITDTFSAVGEWFGEKFRNAWDNITEIFNNIGNWFSDRWNDITNVFSIIGTWFGERFTNAWNNIKSAFSEVKEFFEGIWNSITNVFGHVTNWFRNTFSDAWEAVKNVFSKGGEIFTGITDGIFDTFKTIVNGLIDGINWVIEQPFNAINWALDGIRGIEILDWYPFEWLPSIDIPQIPHLANGGLATAPTLAMVGDNKNAKSDPEVIAPLSKLEGMLGDNSEITELLKVIIELLKNGMNVEIINYMFKNSREFSREVLKVIADDRARKGER